MLKIQMLHFCRVSKYKMKLSAVRKVIETSLFLALGSFGTLGPKLSHGTSWIAEIIHWIISPNVRTHLRKIVNRKTKLDENLALFLLTGNGLFFFI